MEKISGPACPKCGEKLETGDTICKHCKNSVATPERPTFVAHTSILCFLLATFGVYTLFTAPNISILVMVFFVINITYLAYCGYGLLKLKSIARKLFLMFPIIFIGLAFLFTSMAPEQFMGPAGGGTGSSIPFGLILFIIYVMCYIHIWRNKKHFKNGS